MTNKEEDMEFYTKAYRELVWLYEYLCRQTLEERKPVIFKAELEKEINNLLIKYNCMPL